MSLMRVIPVIHVYVHGEISLSSISWMWLGRRNECWRRHGVIYVWTVRYTLLMCMYEYVFVYRFISGICMYVFYIQDTCSSE